ncbi:UNVERIFIED_CONTAM: hypothetical protein RMT77_017438 [Armadillidium vulgare]
MNISIHLQLFCLFVILGLVLSTPKSESSQHSSTEEKSSRNPKFFPSNSKNFFFPHFTNGLKSSPLNDGLQGRLFKFMSTSNLGMDPSQVLYAVLNTNIPKLAEAHVSIANSLDKISDEWEIAFSQLSVMAIVDALNEIAQNVAPATPPQPVPGRRK